MIEQIAPVQQKKREEELVQTPTRVVDNLDTLIQILPDRIQQRLQRERGLSDLLEVVMDLGRAPEARFPDRQVILDELEVTSDEIAWVIARIGQFGDDNRAGIERTLHRISVIRNRVGTPIGLTCRVGRAVFGTIKVIEDLVFSGESLLLMGRPGVGKTTMLREIARVLADDAGKRVVVVDTSNEIAGDGDVPHPGIGRARRMQVASTALQHHVMIEAVENHMPEVIIIDEMSTDLEAMAARTIAERGVQLIATAHGNTLQNLVMNPSLSDLIGGTQAVTLGDVEARRRRSQKTVIERKQRPTFNAVIEIHSWNHVGVHRDVARVVDQMLRGFPVQPEMRWISDDGQLHAERQQVPAPALETRREDLRATAPLPTPGVPAAAPSAPTRVVAFGIPRPMIEAEVQRLGVPVEMVKDLSAADMLVTTKAHYRRRPTAVRHAEETGMPVYVLRKGSPDQIQRYLQRFEALSERTPVLPSGPGEVAREDRGDGVSGALQEAESGIDRILAGEPRIELSPQSAYVRRLQHNLASQFNVGTASIGEEPARRVVLRRRGAR